MTDEPEAHSRRGFLKGLFRDTARGASEVARVVGPPGLKPLLDNLGQAVGGDLSDGETVDWSEAPPLPGEPRVLTPGRAATRTVAPSELLALIQEHDLAQHTDALLGIARPTVRLTPAHDEPAAGRLGGDIELPEGVAWPEWGGLGLAFLARIDLGDPALLNLGLPREGTLLLFYDVSRRPDGRSAEQRGAGQALIVTEPMDAFGGQPVRATVELALPRVWSAAVQGLELEPVEHGAYVRLRAELAQRQGIVVVDDADPKTADHRLLGHPADTTGLMPAICEATARGEDADGTFDPDLAREANARWRLLAQITVDDELDVDPPPSEVQRVFFWVPGEDLDQGDLSRVWAIPHVL